MRSDQIGNCYLYDGERYAAGDGGRQHATQSFPAGDEHDHVSRHAKRERSADSTSSRAKAHHVQSSGFLQHDDGQADGAERNGSGVRQQTDSRSLEPFEPHSCEHGGPHGNGNTGTGRSFDERAECERNQQRLQPAVTGQPSERILNHLELSRLQCEPVEEDRAERDPAGREQAVRDSVQRRREDFVGRHPIDHQDHQDRRDQAGDG